MSNDTSRQFDSFNKLKSLISKSINENQGIGHNRNEILELYRHVRNECDSGSVPSDLAENIKANWDSAIETYEYQARSINAVLEESNKKLSDLEKNPLIDRIMAIRKILGILVENGVSNDFDIYTSVFSSIIWRNEYSQLWIFGYAPHVRRTRDLQMRGFFENLTLNTVFENEHAENDDEWNISVAYRLLEKSLVIRNDVSSIDLINRALIDMKNDPFIPRIHSN